MSSDNNEGLLRIQKGLHPWTKEYIFGPIQNVIKDHKIFFNCQLVKET